MVAATVLDEETCVISGVNVAKARMTLTLRDRGGLQL